MTTLESFASLTQQEQIARIELLGRDALRQFGVEPTSISPLVHAENTTYKVECPEGTFCLRVCRPGYQSTSNVRSEIEFVAALRAAGFPVPQPYEARVVRASAPEVPQERDCVLLRWQEGEFCRDGFTPKQAASLGHLMAEFHNFSSSWTAPPGFDRQQLHSWAFEARPQKTLETKPEAIDETDYRLLLRVDGEARELLNKLPRDDANFGLMHADLHQGNILFDGDEIHIIDFDDLGWGFWLYDFAAALAYQVQKPPYLQVREAMLDAYAAVRPLPPETEARLVPFIQLRLAGISNWVLDRTDNPRMREIAPEFVHSLCEGIRMAEAT